MVRCCRDHVETGTYNRIAHLQRSSEIGISRPKTSVRGEYRFLVDDPYIGSLYSILQFSVNPAVIKASARLKALVYHPLMEQVVAYCHYSNVLYVYDLNLALELLVIHSGCYRSLSFRHSDDLAVLGDLSNLGIAGCPAEFTGSTADRQPELISRLEGYLRLIEDGFDLIRPCVHARYQTQNKRQKQDHCHHSFLHCNLHSTPGFTSAFLSFHQCILRIAPRPRYRSRLSGAACPE